MNNNLKIHHNDSSFDTEPALMFVKRGGTDRFSPSASTRLNEPNVNKNNKQQEKKPFLEKHARKVYFGFQRITI